MENYILDNEQLSTENDYRNYLAPKWKRFINLIFDFYLLYFIAYIVVAGIKLSMLDLSLSGVILWSLLPYLFVLSIYFFSEYTTGKSLGKLITGTKVISVLNEPFTIKQMLGRTFSRIVPFEPFSLLFGYSAWHDDWSDTAVVNNNFETNN
jgi:uncharacterized RDD family membrane protein YckC